MGFRVEMGGSDAPPEMREALEACKADLMREIGKFRLDAPDPEALQKILAAGPGEHQDRLFTIAVKKAMSAFIDRLNDIALGHQAQFEARKPNAGGTGPAETYVS